MFCTRAKRINFPTAPEFRRSLRRKCCRPAGNLAALLEPVDFRYWPSTDMPIALAKVCFEGKSGSGADLPPCRTLTDTVDKVCDKLGVVSFDDLQVSLSPFGCWRPFAGDIVYSTEVLAPHTH